jgi:hypothetical protein
MGSHEITLGHSRACIQVDRNFDIGEKVRGEQGVKMRRVPPGKFLRSSFEIRDVVVRAIRVKIIEKPIKIPAVGVSAVAFHGVLDLSFRLDQRQSSLQFVN